MFNLAISERSGGVKYAPTVYSMQIVDGKRYRFHCRTSVPVSPKTGTAIITIFVPLGGIPELVSIQDTTNPHQTSPSRAWLKEPLYPRTGSYLQPRRVSLRRL